MLYMVIERFKGDNAKDVYERFFDNGRMMPDGLTFIDSWVTIDLCCCYQIVEGDDEALLKEWMVNWEDLVDFTVRPILPGADMLKVFAN